MAFQYAGRYTEAALKTDGTLLKSGSVSVFLPGTSTLATLYTSRTKSATAANPVTTDATSGMLTFYADPGLYDLSGPGVSVASVPVTPDAVEYAEAAGAGQASGYATLDSGSKVPIAQLPTGTSSTTVTIGNDARITGAEQSANKSAASGYQGLDATRRIVSAATAAPTIAAAAGAGTSPPTPTVVSGSNDQRGEVRWGTGTSVAAGDQVTVTFSAAWASAPQVVLVARNTATAALLPYVSAVSTTAVTIALQSAPTASQGATTYDVGFIAAG
ncbi:hypothetical protein [Frankia sp. Cj3]|uniref:hypothetical protein n=1 Tax=Frankia sp. Cj3 TaxID=2880976 RepID=UPI001EF6F89D|nr:hypothetical protein [Frankia sp. Cj3]